MLAKQPSTINTTCHRNFIVFVSKKLEVIKLDSDKFSNRSEKFYSNVSQEATETHVFEKQEKNRYCIALCLRFIGIDIVMFHWSISKEICHSRPGLLIAVAPRYRYCSGANFTIAVVPLLLAESSGDSSADTFFSCLLALFATATFNTRELIFPLLIYQKALSRLSSNFSRRWYAFRDVRSIPVQ